MSPAQAGLADVLPAAAALLGVGQGRADVLPGEATEASAVTVLLVDGLGWWPWQDHADLTPTLSAMSARSLGSTVPSTTPTALASLGTGLVPGGHGIMGAAFDVPEEGAVLHPLSWGSQPHPVAIQPEPTIFEKVAAVGLPVVSIGPAAYRDSGLTRAVLRGGEYVGADGADELVETMTAHRAGLAYAYIPELDRLGHEHGVDSREWRECLTRIDALVARVLDGIGGDHYLMVTADHGMVDCPASARFVMDSLPSMDDVRVVAGEPRLRHVYVSDGASPRIAREWAECLGDRAEVLTREDFIATGLMGAVEPDYAGRIGDVVLMARGDTVLASSVDPLVSGLRGQHGSVSEAELRIPLLGSAGCGRG